ncbi:MAG: GNAT family N-acetyltransferase [Firmicutes bacterium]|nr:GNAT family N-acetyltransferase [Bacillota bacterium]
MTEQDGRIVGFANFIKTPESGDDMVELAAIYVLPERQGQGVGTGLLTAGIRAVPGVSRVMARVNRDNQAGRRFYEAKGFRFEKDLVEEFFGHQQHLIEMILPVAE